MAVTRPHSTETTFAVLGVPRSLTTVLASNGITTPTPIQARSLPDSLAGRDVLGRGQTGSGKTYAFLLPLLTRLSTSNATRQPGRPRALILVPTRELATQIEASLAPLAEALSLRTLTVFGGVGAKPQIAALRRGVDILVACPGRLADHVASGHANLGAVEITVLDEADHMADLGFLPVVRRLMEATPRTGQRLLFSATLDNGVDVLAKQFLNRPVTHSVDSPLSPVAKMTHHVLQLRHEDRLPVLVDLAAAPGRTLVFTRTKHGAKKLTRQLIASGVPAVELHGNLAQNARTRNLQAFSDGATNTLVATDIAARGIHVDDVALVIHADPPVEHKAYLHRSGRTARAGASGIVITLSTDDQAREVRDLTRKAGVNPTTTQIRPGDPLLTKLAPGVRSFTKPSEQPDAAPSGSRSGSRRRSPSGRSGTPTATASTAGRGTGADRAAGRAAGAGRGSAGARVAGASHAAASRAGASHGGAARAAGAGRVAGAGRGAGDGRAAGAGRAAGTGRAAGATTQSAGTHGGAAGFSARSRSGRRGTR